MATAQPAERAPQPAWPSAPARREPDRAGLAAAQSGGTQPAAQGSAGAAGPREPRAGASASAGTLTQARATPPGGRHATRATSHQQRPGPARLTGIPGLPRRQRRKTAGRTRWHQPPGHRQTGAIRSSATPASRGSPARAGRTTPPSTRPHRPPPQTPESRPTPNHNDLHHLTESRKSNDTTGRRD
jgi:hypothetical protein